MSVLRLPALVASVVAAQLGDSAARGSAVGLRDGGCPHCSKPGALGWLGSSARARCIFAGPIGPDAMPAGIEAGLDLAAHDV